MPSSTHELSTFEQYTIGAITALFEVSVTNPLFIMKTNLQQSMPIPWHIKGLYRGAVANAVSFMPITATQVGGAQWLEKTFFSASTYKEKIISAFLAGGVSSLLCCPVERIMLLQNNTPNLSITNAVKMQMKQYGLSGLFVGQTATALREGFFSTFFVAVTPVLKSMLMPYLPNDNVATVTAGFLSGSLAAVISHPVDTIKTTQQSLYPKSLGFFKTAQAIGPTHLFNGLLSRSSSVILSVVLMSWMREQLEHYCMEKKERSSGSTPLL